MSKMIIPEDYKPHLNLIETEVAIKMIKDTFERRLAEQLRLTRVSAPVSYTHLTLPTTERV